MSRVIKLFPFILLLAAVCLNGCGHTQAGGSGAIAKPQETAPVPVTVAQAERKTIPVELHAIGTGKAYQTVSVESQVASVVQEVHYHQGQFVKKGDLLVTLDKSSFAAALSQAQAALARDKAQAQYNQAELQRSHDLQQQGVISREQYDQALAASTSSEATVRADEA